VQSAGVVEGPKYSKMALLATCRLGKLILLTNSAMKVETKLNSFSFAEDNRIFLHFFIMDEHTYHHS
jgi:hypothetical protein